MKLQLISLFTMISVSLAHSLEQHTSPDAHSVKLHARTFGLLRGGRRGRLGRLGRGRGGLSGLLGGSRGGNRGSNFGNNRGGSDDSGSDSDSGNESGNDSDNNSNSNSNGDGSCPQVWYDIAADLRTSFDGCSRNAATAIRFAFHDAAGYSSNNDPYAPASGGADGSLLLSDEEIGRTINDPMQNFREFLLGKYNQYSDQGVSAADFIQVAGNVGIASCPGGPTIRTVVGRSDTSTAPPEGTLPFAFGPNSSYDVLIQLFGDMGFNPRELAALMGAHSVSRSFTAQSQGIPSGGPQDNTPTQWDNNYYSQTQAQSAPRGVFRFASDVNLANPATECGEAYTEFSNDRAAWSDAFQDAMYKMSILGLSSSQAQGLQDCTDILG